MRAVLTPPPRLPIPAHLYPMPEFESVWSWNSTGQVSVPGGPLLPPPYSGTPPSEVMNTIWDLHLDRAHIAGRSFLLGNRRAFSLCLPAAAGPSRGRLHPHKWFGAYLHGRKCLEGQFVKVKGHGNGGLNESVQTGLVAGLTDVRREYEIDGRRCSEEFFVPDGIQGFVCTFSGDLELSVEPEFDIRFSRALNCSDAGYDVEAIESGVLVSRNLPAGRFDDRTETFVPDDGAEEASRLFVAVQVVGDGSRKTMVPTSRRVHRAVFDMDLQRRRDVRGASREREAADHAPLWLEGKSTVYAPASFKIHGCGALLYGVGASKAEALAALADLRDNLSALKEGKAHSASATVAQAPLETGCDVVDRAYVHVLSRLTDALVAREAAVDGGDHGRLATMILAGNRYFHDAWKRDENIALGALLDLGFHDLARDVICDTWRLQDPITGRLPQRIREGETPAYHSSDATLWALWRLHEYLLATGDDVLFAGILPLACTFFERSLERAVWGLLPSGRTTNPDYLWETWMDTPYTPRHGFPVEIQMLWLACLRVFRPRVAAVSSELAAAMRWAETSGRAALRRFVARGVLADSLDETGTRRDLLTPNPYFCFATGVELGPDVERAMLRVGREELAGAQGIVTLAPADWKHVFPRAFLRNRRFVRGRRMQSAGKFNYHRGVEWNWLAQFFVLGELKYGQPDLAFQTYLRAQVDAVLNDGGIGGISELHDLSGARGPEFQTWSMAGFLQALHAFAGVHIDVPARRIAIAPQLPAGWPHLSLRKWFGRLPLDLTYQAADGRSSLSVQFPEGAPDDLQLELVLTLPVETVPGEVEVWLDGTPHIAVPRIETISATDRLRVRLDLPACRSIEVRLTAEAVGAALDEVMSAG